MVGRRRRALRSAVCFVVAVGGAVCDAAHVVEDDATMAPTMVKEGPLEPCVQRLDYHKAVMTKTLLTVSFGAFFLGICACTICGGLCWCLSARISMSQQGDLERDARAREAEAPVRPPRARAREKRPPPRSVGTASTAMA